MTSSISPAPVAVFSFLIMLRKLYSVIMVVSVAVLAAGCDGHFYNEDATRPADATKLYPVGAEVQWARLDVSELAAAGIGPSNYFDVTRFVREYHRDGARGSLEIAAPPGARQSGRIARGVDQVRYIAESNGIPPRRIRVVDRRDGIDGITIRYERIAATAPDCGDWSEDAVRRPEYGPHKNFGCASQRNMAKMVANPTDLLYPEVEGDSASDQRGKQYRTFSAGGQPSQGSSQAQQAQSQSK